MSKFLSIIFVILVAFQISSFIFNLDVDLVIISVALSWVAGLIMSLAVWFEKI